MKISHLTLLSLFALFSSGCCYKVHDKIFLNNTRKECIQELAVPSNLAVYYKLLIYPDDALTHCYIKCVLERYDMFNDNDGFNFNNILAQLGSEDVKDDVKYCIDKKSDMENSCQRAYDAFMCLYELDKEIVRAQLI